MSNSFATGPKYILRGLSLIREPKLRPFVLIPLLINTLLFAFLIWYGAAKFDEMMTEWFSHLPSWLAWLEWLLWPLFVIAAILISVNLFTIIANLISAPFNSLLALRTEEHLTGNIVEESSNSLLEILKSIVPTILTEIGKIFYFVTRAILLFIICLIPIVQVIAPFLWFLFGAWFLVMEYGDYPMANNDVAYDKQRGLMRKNRMTSLGFGGTLTFMTMIPILNFLAMPTGVCGATALWVDEWQQQ
ncbi:MAG: sulfate transporter CysZ, partial [Methylococcales bacterium]|nr:sulfate transporter CysZ [Methylococcales bacterium]